MHILRCARTLFVTIVVVAFVAVAVASTQWLLDGTAALMMYEAWAVDVLQRTPYIDLVDLHPPGAIAAYALAGRVFGYTLAGARFADLAMMIVALALLWVVLKPYGSMTATAAVAIAGLAHMRGIYMFDREAVAMVPILAGTALLLSTRPTNIAAFLAGVAFGSTPWIKPPLAICGAVCVPIWISCCRSWQSAAVFVSGLVTPAVAVLVYLLQAGSLTPFVDMATGFWPVYAQWERVSITHGLAAATPARWVLPAALGGWVSWKIGDSADRQRLMLIAALAAACFSLSRRGAFPRGRMAPVSILRHRPGGAGRPPCRRCSPPRGDRVHLLCRCGGPIRLVARGEGNETFRRLSTLMREYRLVLTTSTLMVYAHETY